VAALGLAVATALVRHSSLLGAAGTTWPVFLTLAAVIAGGLALDGVGLFRLLARLVIPAAAPRWLVTAGVLGFTALLSGLVNLDVAVVVAVPVTLVVARERGLPAGRLAVAAALTANATSFLLPTSNLTTLLVLDHAPLGAWAYLRDSWLAWLLVAALTVGALSALAHASWRADAAVGADAKATARGLARSLTRSRTDVSGPSASAPAASLGRAALALLDLVPMFVAAAAIRALLDGGVVLGGGWLGQLGMASGLAAGANNLPAAAAVVAASGPSSWAAVLRLAIGPNLLLTGSVATLISRRIARDQGVAFGAIRFSLVGAAMLPLQLAIAAIGLHVTGAT
jgi:arsenical pump membrane protein